MRIGGGERIELRKFVIYKFRMITSTRLMGAGHVVRIGEIRSAFKMLSGKPTGIKPVTLSLVEYKGKKFT
jgi:hypothetical protein